VVMDNIRNLMALHKNTVVGTTGWQEHLEEVKQLATDSHTGFLYGANFSIGMNLFGRVVDYAAALFDSFEAYDVYGFEMHHNQKADSPSGTALELANRVLAKSSRKTTVLWDKCDRKIKPEELHFASLRAGAMPGTHKIGFDSEADSVELSHQIRNRSSLALGAILAAKWLAGKQGFYSFNEMIDEILCK
ncbi:MAG TPA: 4-hydroxy-tetrahydrodipicolinate reductase, partial [Candidatus Cloacimonadota bacterium]|nr:4-hydroxy-tetrahydrodipicolinate reductase [Candidatus Cloacimonadota bacterium]